MWTNFSALPFPLSSSPFPLSLLPFSPIQIYNNPKITSGQVDQEIKLRSEKSVPLSTHQQRLWFYTFQLSTHQNVLDEKKVRIYKDVIVAWELFPCCSVFYVLFMLCVLFNSGSFCHVLCSCMRKKLVTELIKVPIKIIGICFTFWPVPKNYQKKIKIIKLYFIKKK
jgi:hypothetical protein